MVEALIKSITKNAEAALRSFMVGKVNPINFAGMKTFGIKENRTVVSEKPYEILFELKGGPIVGQAFETPYFRNQLKKSLNDFFKKNKVKSTEYRLVIV